MRKVKVINNLDKDLNISIILLLKIRDKSFLPKKENDKKLNELDINIKDELLYVDESKIEGITVVIEKGDD